MTVLSLEKVFALNKTQCNKKKLLMKQVQSQKTFPKSKEKK